MHTIKNNSQLVTFFGMLFSFKLTALQRSSYLEGLLGDEQRRYSGSFSSGGCGGQTFLGNHYMKTLWLLVLFSYTYMPFSDL